jgi:hypothetical protein
MAQDAAAKQQESQVKAIVAAHENFREALGM